MTEKIPIPTVDEMLIWSNKLYALKDRLMMIADSYRLGGRILDPEGKAYLADAYEAELLAKRVEDFVESVEDYTIHEFDSG